MAALPLYEQALQFLLGRINYERTTTPVSPTRNFRLGRMRALLSRLGDPHHQLKVVHVAGTKGKGSTATMIASVLQAASYRTGLFCSPHLYRVEERFVVDALPATPAQVADLVEQLRPHVEAMDRNKRPRGTGPTFFEITTAMALVHFLQQDVDVAVLEVGLGGRLDSTNVCSPKVSVITSISRDHTKQLGSSIAEIAAEKAGIVKPGVPVVSGALHSVARHTIAEICKKQAAPLRQLERDFHFRYLPPGQAAAGAEPTHPSSQRLFEDNGAFASCDRWAPLRFRAPGQFFSRVDVQTWQRDWNDLRLPLLGQHQAANAAVAVAVIELLRDQGWEMIPSAVEQGLASACIAARVEVLAEEPTVIVDAAHNYASICSLVQTLQTYFQPRRRLLIFATTLEKDARGMLTLLLPFFDAVVITRYQNNPRGVDPSELAQLAEHLADAPVFVCATPASAWQTVKQLATPQDLICTTGSFFIAAEIRELVLKELEPVPCSRSISTSGINPQRVSVVKGA